MTMNREEAIQCIKHELLITVNRKDLTGQAIGEALDMAIEALEENHCEECLFFGLFHRCKECGRVNVLYDDKFEMCGAE